MLHVCALCRVEDTDQARSTLESEQAMIRDLKWLGLDWDEGEAPGDGNMAGCDLPAWVVLWSWRSTAHGTWQVAVGCASTHVVVCRQEAICSQGLAWLAEST